MSLTSTIALVGGSAFLPSTILEQKAVTMQWLSIALAYRLTNFLSGVIFGLVSTLFYDLLLSW